MPTKRLTEEAVRKLKPPTSQQVHNYCDAIVPGLVLRVNYGGRKTLRALHYLKRIGKDGKRTTIPTSVTLGHYPQLNLKDARDKARQFLADPHKARSHAETGSFRSVAENFLAEFQQALEQLGWIYGRNIQIDIRWGSDPDRIIAYTKELVRLNPDVIFAGPTNVVVPLQRETRSIPIVFVRVADPLGQGIVESL